VPLDAMRSRAARSAAAAVAAVLIASLTSPSGAAAQPAAEPGPLDCGQVDGAAPVPEPAEEVLETIPVGDTWAGHYVAQALLTDGDDQYVAYYDAERRMTVAQRDLDDDTWTTTFLDSVTGWDSHNYLTMAVDREGHLHVTGNMHGDPLVYFRTTVPGDASSLERVDAMVDAGRERRVTYPVFLELGDGTIVFRYRDGASGNGVEYYNQYDEEARRWTGLVDTPIISGEGERNAYAAKPVLGPDGYYHMVWVWRDTPNAATTNNVSYARSADLVNWETSAGEPMPLPITLGSSDVVDPVPAVGGMINNNAQVGFDSDGDPVVSYHKYDDEGNTQVYVARPDGSGGWQQAQLSDWTGAWTFSQGGTLVFQVEMYWPTASLPDGVLRLDVTCQGDARTFLVDEETLQPIEEIATPPTEPREVTELRSDYQHQPEEGELGTQMQVNLNDDSGDAGPFHARPLIPDADVDRRYLMRWESLGENRDRPRATWPAPQPLEVVVLGEPTSPGSKDDCKDGGWRDWTDPTFRNQGQCIAWVHRHTRG